MSHREQATIESRLNTERASNSKGKAMAFHNLNGGMYKRF